MSMFVSFGYQSWALRIGLSARFHYRDNRSPVTDNRVVRAMKRLLIGAALAACAAGLMWIFAGSPATADWVNNANVVGGAFATMGVALSIAALWPASAKTARRSTSPTRVQLDEAAQYLAEETLHYWRRQAKDRRITTPCPASVRWRWASSDIGVPVNSLRSPALTRGVVTELRQQLFDTSSAPPRIGILGPSGAGKTTAMVLLLIEILEHRAARDSGGPVPVWLTLGGWDPRTVSLHRWAADSLNRNFPGLAAAERGGSTTARDLIRTGRLALFLDGLDEMPKALLGVALDAVDRETQGLRVVLTSRSEEYRAAIQDGRIWDIATIEVLPVEPDEVGEFLLAQQLGDQRDRWLRVVSHLEEFPESVAARTLTTPLALSLARDAYSRSDPVHMLDTRSFPTPDDLLQHLIAKSLAIAYPDPVERSHAIHWLAWLARHLGTSRDVRWWSIPHWIKIRPRFLLRVFIESGHDEPKVLTFRSITEELPGLLTTGIFDLAVYAVLFTLLGGALDLFTKHPHEGSLEILLLGLGVGLAIGLGLAVTRRTKDLMDFWSIPVRTSTASDPIEVYRSDRRRSAFTAVLFSLGGLAGMVLFTILVATVFHQVRDYLPIGADYRRDPAGWTVGASISGGLIGFISGIVASGVALGPAVKLRVLESVWRVYGRRVSFIPLLQTAQERQVLRQVGSLYQFRHAALQDYLAKDVTALRRMLPSPDDGLEPDN